MNAWTGQCPVCRRDIAYHNEATASLHYRTWQRTMEGRTPSLFGEAHPFSIVTDETPSLIGEWDSHLQKVFHASGKLGPRR